MIFYCEVNNCLRLLFLLRNSNEQMFWKFLPMLLLVELEQAPLKQRKANRNILVVQWIKLCPDTYPMQKKQLKTFFPQKSSFRSTKLQNWWYNDMAYIVWCNWCSIFWKFAEKVPFVALSFKSIFLLLKLKWLRTSDGSEWHF